MGVEMIMENFPIHTYGTYILTSSNDSIYIYCLKKSERILDLLSIPQSGVLIHTSACCSCN